MTDLRSLVRTSRELELMRESGKISAAALKKTIEAAKPGVSLIQLDKIAEDEMIRLGATASFKTVPGYHWATCLTINEEVVHGIPRDILLKEGDVLNIDLGALYKGWHTDTAWSKVVGQVKDPEKERFLRVGEEALLGALKQAKMGKRVGDISSVIQTVIERAGYSVIKSLSGHGVGRAGHEEPGVPTYGKVGSGPQLLEGMTIAVEAIYGAGSGQVYEKDDGWTIALVDGSWGGLFEHSIIVGKNGPEILTDWKK